MKNMPRPTMMRNDQKSVGTCGIVSRAAWAICSSVAWRGSST